MQEKKNRSSIQFACSFRDETSGDMWHLDTEGQALGKLPSSQKTSLTGIQILVHWCTGFRVTIQLE